MSELRSYRRRVVFFALLGFAYLAVAMPNSVISDEEIFPFFNWSLFTDNTPTQIETIAVVKSINGQTLETPKSYFELKDRFSEAAKRNPQLIKILKRFTTAYHKNDIDQINRLVGLIEGYYLRDAAEVEYEILVIKYDVMKRYEDGSYVVLEHLGSYSKGV